MYAHCIFCYADLGANEAIERFPVGRRLAFDPAKGRLWVVCRRCERWNLTPLEERWEAIEEAERRFRDTRRRVSTEHVGLARLPEGLELVRIGRPQRPEFAAWRYGDQFGRRRRQLALRGGAVAAGATALLVGGPLLGAAAGTVFLTANLLGNVAAVALAKRSELLLPHPEGGQLHLTLNQLHEVRLLARPDAGWALEVPFASHRLESDGWWEKLRKTQNMTMGRVTVEGPAAERIAGKLLPRINGRGASPTKVSEAVAFMEGVGDPARLFGHAASRTREWGYQQRWGDTGALRFLPQPVRLALEMAAHEDAERRAMEGELAALEAAWAEAERIAAIADDLLLPAGVEGKLRAMKGEG
jgi:hypothetical protein